MSCWSSKREMPKCDACSHRRILHTLTVWEIAPNGRRVNGQEAMVACSIPDCTCQVYAPRSTERVP